MEDLQQAAAAPPASAAPRAQRSALLIVFLVVFIDLFGFGIVLPLLPRYGREFIPGGEDSKWTGPILGALMASFSAMQFVFAPLWGRISDRIGRRPILLLGLVSSVVFYTLFGVASLFGREGLREIGLVLLFVSRIGAGIAGATISTAQAVIADCTPPEGRSRGMALIGAAFGIGFFFGPLLGFGALYFFPGFAGGPGFLAAGLSLTALVLGFILLPETVRPGVAHGRRTLFDLQGLRNALRTPAVGALILIFFLSTVAFACFEPTLALLTQMKAIGISTENNFLIFAYVGFVLALAQGGLYRRLALRVPELTFMWMGALLMMVGLGALGVLAWHAAAVAPDYGRPREVLLLLSSTPVGGVSWPGLFLNAPQQSSSLLTLLLAVLAVAITGFSFMVPSVQALISRLSDPTKQGEVLGINQSANAVSRILGPALGVPLFYVTPNHVIPYIFSAVLLLAALLLTLGLRANAAIQATQRKEAVHAR